MNDQSNFFLLCLLPSSLLPLECILLGLKPGAVNFDLTSLAIVDLKEDCILIRSCSDWCLCRKMISGTS